VISFERLAQKRLQIEFSGKDYAFDEVASPNLSFSVANYGMSMDKRFIVPQAYVSGTIDQFHRLSNKDLMILKRCLIIIAKLCAG
jgi:hypothetical protein